ncbi:Predicted arabinose efflux permease, MFS family [Desulfatibacillum alkenivorans DSM 16219]|jgi:predicted MFS family arabinose efflux permease|uniref:Predicted arabinose efflux permease, MFS family n=1 Tax=Desulfatibacillum alkenivorans DSM 16219 TaxID=1121393 RepID=A0A1M6D3C6_9BACT|nr:MFS transporter [Desulfatibacillum alkenivorans]SHI67498.1 Predicted arabinose efflux permease, MFS family [Desulfatibacillum alkenivorans DSM 16219]
MFFRFALATYCRFLLNVSRRFAYPFAPVLARGLGVPLTAISSILALNQFTTLSGVVIGPATDRIGYKPMMLTAMGMLSLVLLAGGLVPQYGMVMAALLLVGLGKSIFDPALQAYVGKHIPFEKRGMVVGLLEVAWAASMLIGIPLIGYAIETWGWRSPFIILGCLCLGGLVLLFYFIPGEKAPAASGRGVGYKSAWKALVRERACLGILGFSFLLCAGNDCLFIASGAWMEESFGLGIAALGMGAGIIGLAELCGEGLTASLSDKIGLPRAIMLGGICCAASYCLLPVLSFSLPSALSGIFLVFMAFEFTIVSTLALSTELLPAYRATLMSGLLSFAGLGRSFGTLMGGFLWERMGIPGIGAFSAAMTVSAVLFLAWSLKGWKKE